MRKEQQKKTHTKQHESTDSTLYTGAGSAEEVKQSEKWPSTSGTIRKAGPEESAPGGHPPYHLKNQSEPKR